MGSNKKKVGIIIGIVIAILVIIGGILAFLYLKTDTFKTPQQLFYSYLMQNEQVLEGLNVTNSIATTKDMLKDKQYTTNGSFVVNYKDENETQVTNIMSVVIEGKTDELEQQEYSKIKLLNPSNESEELFNAEYLRTNDLYALTSNQVVNLYLAVQNNNLKSFAKKLGITDASQIPDKIEIENLEEKSKVSEEQLKSIFDKYFNLLVEKIPSEKYTKQKNVSMTINEQNYNKLDIYALTLNQKEVASILKPVLQTLKDDEETLNSFLELYKTDKALDDLNELKNQIQEMINKIDSSELTDDVAIKLNVYAQDKNLIKTQVQLGNGIDEGIIVDVIPTKTEQEVNVLFTFNNIQNAKENYAGTLTVNKSDNNNHITLDIGDTTINLLYSEAIEDENNINKSINISYVYGENEIEFSYNEKKTIAQNLKIDKLDSNTNCVILNDYPQEALQLLMTQLGERLGQIFTEIGNKTEITSFIQKIQSYYASQNATEDVTNTMEEQEKEMFNSQFTYYDVQNISGTNVKALLTTIISSNKSVNRGVGVTYNGSENKITEEEINTIVSEIELNSNYNVSFEYSDEGYINLVRITQS